jgi:hypothetical protein
MFQRDAAAKQYELQQRQAADASAQKQADVTNWLNLATQQGVDPGIITQAIASMAPGADTTYMNNMYEHQNPHQEFKSFDLGGQMQTGSFDPRGGGFTAGDQFQISESPDAQLQARTSRANANTAAGASMYGSRLSADAQRYGVDQRRAQAQAEAAAQAAAPSPIAGTFKGEDGMYLYDKSGGVIRTGVGLPPSGARDVQDMLNVWKAANPYGAETPEAQAELAAIQAVAQGKRAGGQPPVQQAITELNNPTPGQQQGNGQPGGRQFTAPNLNPTAGKFGDPVLDKTVADLIAAGVGPEEAYMLVQKEVSH